MLKSLQTILVLFSAIAIEAFCSPANFAAQENEKQTPAITFKTSDEKKRKVVYNVVSSNNPDWTIHNGKIIGDSANVLRLIMDDTGLAYRFDSWPWARAYKAALTQPNVLLSQLGRNPQRENLFHWIGPTSKPSYVNIYGLKTNPNTEQSLSFYKKQTIAVENNSHLHDFLSSQQFEKIYPVSDPSLYFQMLLKGRVDYIIAGDLWTQQSYRGAIDPNKLKIMKQVYEVRQWFAVGKQVDKLIVKTLTQSYEKLKRQGKLKSIEPNSTTTPLVKSAHKILQEKTMPPLTTSEI